MSHIKVSETTFIDLESLFEVLQEMGGVVHRDKLTHAWYGTDMRDTAMPDWMPRRDMGKCLHCVSFPGIEYEVGIVKDPHVENAYRLAFDYWGPGEPLLEILGGKEPTKVIANYNVKRIKAVAHARRKAGEQNRVTVSQPKEGLMRVRVRISA